MNCKAISSGSKAWTRSSVDRITRDTSEVPMIVRMKHDAIFITFGPLDDVDDVVYTKTSEISPKPTN